MQVLSGIKSHNYAIQGIISVLLVSIETVFVKLIIDQLHVRIVCLWNTTKTN